MSQSKEFDKHVLTTFQKLVHKSMRDLKGRWTGHVYVFKTKEQYELAQAMMLNFKKEYDELLKTYPKDTRDTNAELAYQFFQRLKKFDPTKLQ